MKTILLLIAFSLSSSLAFAATEDLSKECKTQLKTEMLQQVKAQTGLELKEENIEFRIALSSKKDNLYLEFTDRNNGAYLTFSDSVTESDLSSCNIQPVLKIEDSCRYSNYGEKDFDEIENMIVSNDSVIVDDQNLNSTQIDQLMKLLAYDDSTIPLNELIANTDDGEVLYSLVTLPDGQKLDYYKAYGGDNAFGVFYYRDTSELAGTNSDGSFCILFPKK